MKYQVKKKFNLNQNLIYKQIFISPNTKLKIFNWLESLHPIWEMRYSNSHPPPESSMQRRLLRPVYWLGNWQFACLNYFHPPKNIYNCCIEAEPFPEIIQEIALSIENEVHQFFKKEDVPTGWHFNTCLINFYGSNISMENKRIDAARVGEHKDFEPGPVGSISFGEKALFQFVTSLNKGSHSRLILQQWLEDSSLQVFGGDKFKKKLFHRIQRVEKKSSQLIGPKITNFETRRINLTFRYVPNEFIIPFCKLPKPLKDDILPYIKELGQYSTFFKSLNLNNLNSKHFD